MNENRMTIRTLAASVKNAIGRKKDGAAASREKLRRGAARTLENAKERAEGARCAGEMKMDMRRERLETETARLRQLREMQKQVRTETAETKKRLENWNQ